MSVQQGDRRRQVELIVREVDRLPTLSPIAARLFEAANVDDIDVNEVIKLIEMDPAMSATILRLCRSVEHGLGDKITTVRRAVLMLGLETVRSIALSVEVLDLLRSSPDQATTDQREGFDEEGFWRFAVATASACDLIAKASPALGLHPGVAFLAGLLHGLGRLVLHLVLPHAYDRALVAAEQRRSASAAVERAVLGMDHHTAGRRLADRWGLPDGVRDVIWFHGQPAEGLPESVDRSLIMVVTLARALCARHHLGWSGDYCPPPAIEPLARQVGLDGAHVDKLVPTLVDAVAERCQILGLGQPTAPDLLLGAIMEANRRLGALNAALEREARLSRRREQVCEAIRLFHERWRGGEPFSRTLECVAESFLRLLGPGFCGMLWRLDDEREWRVVQFNEDGRATRAAAIDLPPTAKGLTEGFSEAGGVSLATMALLPDLSDFLVDAPDLTRIRLMPVLIEEACAVALLHDADTRSWHELAPIRAVWASAIRTAEAWEQSRLLEDELAASNRALVEMQAELAERESLARLGEMTAGAAHEMNNPLAVIKGRAQLLESRLRDTELASSVASLVSAADHLSELITELNRLACADGPIIEPTSMDQVIARALERAGERLGGRPMLDVVGPAESTLVETDRELLADALSELIVNAEEAGSTEKVRIEVQSQAGLGRLYLRVADKGHGMSERAMKHAFDPFFSEKPAGRQRGLGLARARRCVELLGGRIWLERSEGGGIVATIELETAPPAASAA